MKNIMRAMRSISVMMIIAFWLVPLSAIAHTNASMSGRMFEVDTFEIAFEAGPFSPGESGMATLTCGKDVAIYQYMFSPPLLILYLDGSPGIFRFVIADGALYYLDPLYLVLTE